jgi:DNA-binding CsgD family transcriptional regulator
MNALELPLHITEAKPVRRCKRSTRAEIKQIRELYAAGKKPKEIAAIMGIKASRVASLRHYHIKRLRKAHAKFDEPRKVRRRWLAAGIAFGAFVVAAFKAHW